MQTTYTYQHLILVFSNKLNNSYNLKTKISRYLILPTQTYFRMLVGKVHDQLVRDPFGFCLFLFLSFSEPF